MVPQVTPLDRVPRSSARITLSRPEERWKGPCKQDSVGCMLGFYIVTCDRERDSKFHDGRTGNPNMETNFVPMHTGTRLLRVRVGWCVPRVNPVPDAVCLSRWLVQWSSQ